MELRNLQEICNNNNDVEVAVPAIGYSIGEPVLDVRTWRPNFDTAPPDAHRSTRNIERHHVDHMLVHEAGRLGGSERGEPKEK